MYIKMQFHHHVDHILSHREEAFPLLQIKSQIFNASVLNAETELCFYVLNFWILENCIHWYQLELCSTEHIWYTMIRGVQNNLRHISIVVIVCYFFVFWNKMYETWNIFNCFFIVIRSWCWRSGWDASFNSCDYPFMSIWDTQPLSNQLYWNNYKYKQII